MHDPAKPPEGDISKCPFFAALSGAMSAFAQGTAAKQAEPNGSDAPAAVDAFTPKTAERASGETAQRPASAPPA